MITKNDLNSVNNPSNFQDDQFMLQHFLYQTIKGKL